MKLNCLIVDDEPLSIKVIRRYCEDLPSLSIAGSCSDAFQALDQLKSKSVDLLFLDINMPRLSGLAMLKSLKNPPMVIIITAYPEFAVEGFELEVLDYLVKPFGFERFLKAVNKAVEQKKVAVQLQELPEKKASSTLLIKADRKLHQLRVDSIQYLQAYGDYVKIFTTEGMLMPKETLQQLATKLPKQKFLQVHRSYIVALLHIKYVEGNQISLGAEKIPVGSTYKQALLNKI